MDSHLAKPLTADTLLDAVTRVVGGGGQMHTREQTIPLKVLTAGSTHAGSVSAPPIVPGEPERPNPERPNPERSEPEAVLPDLDQAAFKRTASFLSPEAVVNHLQTIGGRGEALLRRMQVPNVLTDAGTELAVAAHTLAGGAGMFGFQRLADAARRFEHAIQSGTAEVPVLALGLTDAVQAVLQEIRSRNTAQGDPPG